MRCVRIMLALASLLALDGCRSALSIWNTHGPASKSIGALSWVMSILFLSFTLIMWVLFATALYKRRGTLSEHEPIDADGGQIWVAIGGLAVPIVVLTALLVAGLSLMSNWPIFGASKLSNVQKAKSMKPEILIIGHQWWWEIHYLNDDPSKGFITANELHLPAGRPVSVEVETADVMHSFWIPALNGKIDMVPNQPNYIRMMASQPGIYKGECAEFCGDEHARMRLLAVVQEPAAYRAWMAQQLQPGAQPNTPEAKSGEQIFLSGPCSLCHTVRGTIAGGRVAPDLTHVGSRMMIAANAYPNNNAYLEAWITHAQSLKPDALMPDLPDFTGEQLSDLTAYLRQLR